MTMAGNAPVFVFLAGQVSTPVIQILTAAGTTGLITALLKFAPEWRGQSQAGKNAQAEREEKLRRRIEELEDQIVLRDDEIASKRRQIREAEVLIEAQTSTIAMDNRKITLMDEEIKWLRKLLRTGGDPNDGR